MIMNPQVDKFTDRAKQSDNTEQETKSLTKSNHWHDIHDMTSVLDPVFFFFFSKRSAEIKYLHLFGFFLSFSTLLPQIASFSASSPLLPW